MKSELATSALPAKPVVTGPVRRRESLAGWALAAPLVLYIGAFFVIPAVTLFIYSFWLSIAFRTERTFTLQNYVDTLTDSTFYTTTMTALVVGMVTATISIVMSFPIAYLLVFRIRSNLLLYLIMVSALSSYLVRVYAWRIILGRTGILNRGLELLGIIDHPLNFLLFSRTAVVITLVHIFLPFTLLLLRSALQGVRFEHLEAARDLGAGAMVTFLRVMLPLSLTGVLGAFMFTFVLAAGDYVTPQLVGGTSGVTTGLIVANQFILSGNWPLGSAMAFVLLVVFVLVYLALLGITRVTRVAPRVRWR